MAISIDWPSGVITVNQSDPEVSLVSGTTYELDTNAFRLALKALEDDPEGIVWPRTHRHNTVVTIDGVNYVRTIEIINGYTITVLPNSSWRLRMDGGSNNNFHSEGILNLNSVQVIPANSAGNIETTTSGLTSQESDDLSVVRKEATNRRELVNLGTEQSPDWRWRTWDDNDTDIVTDLDHYVADKDGDQPSVVAGAIAKRSKGGETLP